MELMYIFFLTKELMYI